MKCLGNGCNELTFVCEAGASCSVSPSGCTLDNSADSVDGIICPTVQMSDDTVDVMKEALFRLQSAPKNTLDDGAETPSVSMNEAVLSAEATVVCDKEEECKSDSFSDGEGVEW